MFRMRSTCKTLKKFAWILKKVIVYKLERSIKNTFCKLSYARLQIVPENFINACYSNMRLGASKFEEKTLFLSKMVLFNIFSKIKAYLNNKELDR